MEDRVFRIAPGQWDMFRCSACGSGWLDPRPDSESLPRAYAGYFTHDEIRSRVIVRRKGFVRRWLHDLLNGYMNQRYGTQCRPAASAGRWLAPLFPPLRAAADATCRHLPPLPNGGGLLLDVGCGNGAFLHLARDAGWQVRGIDFDPEAVARARAAGLDARVSSVESLALEMERYDVITMSHVIEHVRDPNATLRCLNGLLKPGGMLWLETPNLKSLGHMIYGRDWRGLEPPRHLALMTDRTLRMALEKAGFRSIRRHWSALVSMDILRISSAIRSGTNISAATRNKVRWPMELAVEGLESVFPTTREFLTVTAKKPER